MKAPPLASPKAPISKGPYIGNQATTYESAAAAAAKLLQSCPTLCNPIDGSPPGSSVPGILQVRTLEWVAISSSNACMHAKSLQSCPTLSNPMDSSPPGSSVHGILQARVLEWVAISFSNREASKYLKQILKDLKGEIKSKTIIAEDI